MTSQIVCEAVTTALPADIGLYRIPYSQWFSWVAYRIKRFGAMTMIGHIGLSLYLSFRTVLLRFNRHAWSKTSHYTLPDRAVSLKSERALLDKFKSADAVLLMEPFRLPRSAYSNKSTTYLEVVWGGTPDYMGDSAGWWQKVNEDGTSTSVSIIQRAGEASDLTLLAAWEVPLEPNYTIGRVRLEQAKVLMKQLPIFLKQYTVNKPMQNKSVVRRQSGYSYVSPTLGEYLRYNRAKVVPESVINRRRSRVDYKVRVHEVK